MASNCTRDMFDVSRERGIGDATHAMPIQDPLLILGYFDMPFGRQLLVNGVERAGIKKISSFFQLLRGRAFKIWILSKK